MKINDVEGTRSFEIDGNNAAVPGSVFLMSDNGFCLELDRTEFLSMVKRQFGLYEPTDVTIERLLSIV